MTKQKIEIEVDIPDGYEFVRFGVPEVGEIVDSIGGSAYPRIIIRKAWQWPPWLKADYIVMDKEGRWYAYTRKPAIETYGWYAVDGNVCFLSSGMFDFVPPPCDDWTQSLRVRPGVEQ